MSNNGGDSWTDLENTNNSNNSWLKKQFVISDYINLTNAVQFRFTASDLFNNGDVGSGGSLVEAALDDFLLEAISFDLISGDLNFDSNVNVLDVVLLVNFILNLDTPSNDQYISADINSDQSLDVVDVVLLVNLILE